MRGDINSEYAYNLRLALTNGWRPDIERLERLQHVQNMQRVDYQESWAWVHFMLHSTPKLRKILLDYLQDLQSTPHPGPLSQRLQQTKPDVDQQFVSYMESLASTIDLNYD